MDIYYQVKHRLLAPTLAIKFDTSHWFPVVQTDGHVITKISQMVAPLASLSSYVFEPRTATGSGQFAILSRHFEQFFFNKISIRVKKLSNTNLVAFWHVKKEKG